MKMFHMHITVLSKETDGIYHFVIVKVRIGCTLHLVCFNSIFVLIANANADSSEMWALVGSEKVFRYQHVGIGNLKSARWGSKPTRDPQSEWFHVAVEYRL